jgi:phosphoserine phosphatase
LTNFDAPAIEETQNALIEQCTEAHAIRLTYMNRIFLFDFDGTISKREMVPLLAEGSILEESISKLTQDTVNGLVEFEESYRRRVKLLENIPQSEICKKFEQALVHEKLLSWIIDHREICYVVSGQLDIWMNPWLNKHGLNGFTSQAKYSANSIHLEKIIKKEDIAKLFPNHDLITIGDGANDVPLMRKSKFSIGAELIHSVPSKLWDVADVIIWKEESLCQVLSQLL